jgi:geranylgeranyl pyrophosphate synthase
MAELVASGALGRARARAESIVARSATELAQVPPGPARDALEAAANAIVQRDF